MSKVFLVSSGDYSDYRIVAVFSTEAKAEEYIRVRNELEQWSCNEGPDEWEVDSIQVKEEYFVEVYLRPDNDASSISEADTKSPKVEKLWEDCHRVTTRFCGSREKTIKSARDMVTKFQAQEAGI